MPIIYDCSNMNEFDATIHVLGIMLFSDNEKMMRSFIIRTIIWHHDESDPEDSQLTDNETEQCAKLGERIGKSAYSVGGFEKLINSICTNQQESIFQGVTKRVRGGMLTSWIMGYAFERKSSITEAADKIYGSHIDFLTQKGLAQKEMSVDYYMKVMWSHYRRTAHLWLAAMAYWHHPDSEFLNPDTSYHNIFKCPSVGPYGLLEGIYGFLRLAETFRKLGTTTIPSRQGSNKPLLDPESTYVILPPKAS